MDTSDAGLMKISEQCVKESGVSADEAKVMMADNMEVVDEKTFTNNMKCFLLYFYKKIGILSADGKPVTTALVAFMEERFSDRKDKVKPAIAKCVVVTDPNPCQAIFKFEMCMAEAVHA